MYNQVMKKKYIEGQLALNAFGKIFKEISKYLKKQSFEDYNGVKVVAVEDLRRFIYARLTAYDKLKKD